MTRRSCRLLERTSEKHITLEAEWMAKQGYKWTDSEEDPIPAAESDGERSSDYSA